MTRLLCTGDLHLRDDRLDDQALILDQLVDLAKSREVDGVLLAGDIFDRPKPTPTELHAFRAFARRLERYAIPTVAVLGNAGHDQLGADQPAALELFEHGDWMRVSRHPELVSVAGVTVCTLPSTPVTRLVAERGTREDVNALVVQLLLGVAAELREQAAGPAVLLGHWSVTGASLPNGLPTSDMHEPVLPLDELEELCFDAVVLGHIHKPQTLNIGPRPVIYTGSPLTLNFGEADVDHGCFVVGVGAELFSAEFVPLEGRRFVTVDVDLGEHIDQGLDETDVIAAHIAAEIPITDAVIRIRYRCTEEQARRVDVQALRGFCLDAGAQRVAQIVPEIVHATRARVASVDETVGPRDALALYADSAELDELQRRGVTKLLDAYLEEAAA